MVTQDFWNKIYAEYPSSFPNKDMPELSSAMKHFGDISGAKILDLGCGSGSSSLFFAMKGAEVTAIDISKVAIQNLSEFCIKNQIQNIRPIHCSAFEISEQGKFDYVFGNMILHHLEPFDVFTELLRNSIVPGGKAFFHENNAFSDLLIWFRNNLVGKYGIPKYGDDEEFPLMPTEVAILRKYFCVEQFYPELAFFGLISIYLLRGKFHPFFKAIDNHFFQYKTFKKYSYRQYILLS